MTTFEAPGSDALTTLDVRARDKGDGTAQYLYQLRSAEGSATGPLEQEYSVDVHQSLVRMLCTKLNKVLREKPAASGESRVVDLSRVGHALCEALFPLRYGNVPDLVTRLRESSGPLLVRTDEMVVPWELLFFEDEFLGLTREIGRRSVVQRRVVRGRRINGIHRALIVGDPVGDLPDAAREAENVAEWMRAKGTECTVLLRDQANLADVVMELSERRYDLFHYCGHVATGPGTAPPGLVLHDRMLLDERALPSEVPPVVFINGCKSAGRVENICVSFMVMGAQAVVGTRTEVPEEKARRFAEEFYRLLTDMTTGAAVRAARLALSADDDDLTWASFMLYGDPTVRITGGGVPDGDQPGVRHDEQLDFEDGAQDVLSRAFDAARGRRLLTSVHLLIGLIGSAELRPRITASIGAERLTQVTERLTSVGVVGPRDEPEVADDPDDREGGGTVPSDTVTLVIIRADELASAVGRTRVSVHDLAVAFLESGAGTSAREVESCGVTVEKLLSVGATDGSGPTGAGGTLLGGRGRIQPEQMDPAVARAVRTALALSVPRGEVIGTYALLLGFGLAGSPVLREALTAQGERGRRALRLLFGDEDPGGAAFSRRTLAALEAAHAADPGRPLSEAAVLRALLKPGTTAGGLLRSLGVDPEAVKKSLPPPG